MLRRNGGCKYGIVFCFFGVCALGNLQEDLVHLVDHRRLLVEQIVEALLDAEHGGLGRGHGYRIGRALGEHTREGQISDHERKRMHVGIVVACGEPHRVRSAPIHGLLVLLLVALGRHALEVRNLSLRGRKLGIQTWAARSTATNEKVSREDGR